MVLTLPIPPLIATRSKRTVMSDAQRLPQISLTFNQPVCRQLVRDLELVSHRLMQVHGVRSVVTQLDVHGCQRMVIYTEGIDHPVLLRRMAAELRKPIDDASIPAWRPPVTHADPTPELISGSPGDFAKGMSIETVTECGGGSMRFVGRIRQFAYGSLAVTSVGMAWVGLLVPGVPTVPFVILAAVCAAKTSPAFRQRLKRTRVFGPMISDWDKYRAIRPQVRVQAIVATLIILTITLIIAQPSPALLAVIGTMCVVTFVIIARIPVITPEPDSNPSELSQLKKLPAVA